jgi:hypothetical protein
MRRRELLRRIGERARSRQVPWALMRQGADHEVWRCGEVQVTIPRHAEVNEVTAVAICRALEAALGEGWWRR